MPFGQTKSRRDLKVDKNEANISAHLLGYFTAGTHTAHFQRTVGGLFITAKWESGNESQVRPLWV